MKLGIVLLAICLACTQLAAAESFPYATPWNDQSANLSNISSWNEKPAGQHGFVKVRDGHLYAGDQRLRLLGVNIVFGSCFPSHAEADGVAARLARFGVNIVRFHHMDSSPAPRGLLQRDMRTIDSSQLEKLDYFVAALKREGIYSNLNLHVGRMYPGFKGWGEEPPKYWKGVDHFFAPMIEAQKSYARDLLLHTNAYTGRRYVDEPAVALIEINNENGLLREWRTGSLNRIGEPYRGALQAQWTHWLAQRYAGDAALAKAWGAREVPLGAQMLGTRFGVGSGEAGWNLQLVGGAKASYSPQADGGAELKVTAIDADRWHVQWHQNKLQFKAGEPYTLSLRLRADRPLRLRLQAMQAHAPWAHLWESELTVDTEWRDYRFSFAPTADEDNARLTIGDLGASLGTLSLASASLKPGGRLGLEAGESLTQGSIAIPTTSNFLSRTLNGQRDWLQFLWDTETAYWRGMQDFLKQDLGAKPLIIGTQVSYSPAPIQAQLDVVDAHAYWQHPQFPGKPWDINNWRIGNQPMAGLDGGGTLPDLALRRVPGKPFIVTEYNHPMPNEFAAETFPLVAAYAAMQDWDGFFVYSYGAHDGNWNPGYRINFFDIHADPVKMSSLIAAAALFRRADVQALPLPAETLPSQSAMIDVLRGNYRMPSAEYLGVARNLSLLRAVSLGTQSQQAPSLPIRSEGGELLWGVNKQATLAVDTPRSKLLIGAALKQAWSAADWRLQLLESTTGSGVLALTAIDAQNLQAPGRILLTALGNAENTGQRWLDDTHTSLGRNFGHAPVLAEGIRARIEAPVPAARVQAWALDERGARKQALPVGGTEQAVIEIGPQYQALWYELQVR